eukprot:7235466-Alexandrium_andersonii.AAC.1
MSASLVGSEMCIRDRPWRSAPQFKLAGGHRPLLPQTPCPCWRGGGPPVSYTHLTLPTICSV